MTAAQSASDSPFVSVIIPARNEEASLAACLESLVTQDGVNFEVIVVDDGSSDGTRRIAESVASVRVISPGPLPPGWTGKNNAVAAGAAVAKGEWLLFTDADTVHQPGSLAASVAEAREHGAALLSYSPEQEVRTFWERAVMPVIFAELASRYRPAEVSDPQSPAAAANGQYILVSREAYKAVGGHAAVGGDLLEDVALARAVKLSGRKIFFRYGGDRVRTRMYRNFTQLREGWTKNLARLFASPGRLAVRRLGEFMVIAGCAAGAVVLGRSAAALVAGGLCLVLYVRFLVRIQKAHFKWDSNFLALAGLPVVAYLLLRSKKSYESGAVTWKGRTYPGKTSSSQPAFQHSRNPAVTLR
jgi:glycosyltransferase involved in cell wall biosynthesis